MANSPSISLYGWTPVPRDVSTLLSSASPSASSASASERPAKPISVSDIKLPDSELVRKVREYAEKELPIETLHHSMRIYYYGQAIIKHAFPTWSTPSFDETYFVTCLLHDIGATPKHMEETMMSFEFHGAFLALNLLTQHLEPPAPAPQAESVSESIIRHQDLGSAGTLTTNTALLQLATIFDNVGNNSHLVHKQTIESVVQAWPRRGWSGCFADTIEREMELKGWANSRRLEEKGFPDGVRANSLMAPYDK